MKKYIAKTSVSINIVLGGGANRHIAFTSLTGGGSVFYTDDPEIQSALERHYKFGKLFILDTPKDKPISPIDKPISPEDKPVSPKDKPGDGDETEAVVNPGLKTIVVTDPDSAKAYLAEHFGISRTKLTSIKKIKEAAEANGIVFEGI